ncbi:hypothetical protein H4582DRAFT_1970951 [Lactarius indigo]|nr:hypothetical protein H4582DRAFT_1970951 [Lactarius indigo]
MWSSAGIHTPRSQQSQYSYTICFYWDNISAAGRRPLDSVFTIRSITWRSGRTCAIAAARPGLLSSTTRCRAAAGGTLCAAVPARARRTGRAFAQEGRRALQGSSRAPRGEIRQLAVRVVWRRFTLQDTSKDGQLLSGRPWVTWLRCLWGSHYDALDWWWWRCMRGLGWRLQECRCGREWGVFGRRTRR